MQTLKRKMRSGVVLSNTNIHIFVWKRFGHWLCVVYMFPSHSASSLSQGNTWEDTEKAILCNLKSNLYGLNPTYTLLKENLHWKPSQPETYLLEGKGDLVTFMTK